MTCVKKHFIGKQLCINLILHGVKDPIVATNYWTHMCIYYIDSKILHTFTKCGSNTKYKNARNENNKILTCSCIIMLNKLLLVMRLKNFITR